MAPLRTRVLPRVDAVEHHLDGLDHHAERRVVSTPIAQRG